MFGTIELEGGSFQYRESLAYELKPKSLRLLKEAGLPQEFLAILKSLKNEKYPTQKLFMEAIYSIADNVGSVAIIIKSADLLAFRHNYPAKAINCL